MLADVLVQRGRVAKQDGEGLAGLPKAVQSDALEAGLVADQVERVIRSDRGAHCRGPFSAGPRPPDRWWRTHSAAADGSRVPRSAGFVAAAWTVDRRPSRHRLLPPRSRTAL